MHVEFAIFATDHLVAEGGKLFYIIITIESKGEFMLIRVLRFSCSELSSVEQKVTGIEGHVLLVRKYDVPTLNNDSVQFWSTHIHKQSHSSWNIH